MDTPRGAAPEGAEQASHEHSTTADRESQARRAQKARQGQGRTMRFRESERTVRRRAALTAAGQWESGGGTPRSTHPGGARRAGAAAPTGAACRFPRSPQRGRRGRVGPLWPRAPTRSPRAIVRGAGRRPAMRTAGGVGAGGGAPAWARQRPGPGGRGAPAPGGTRIAGGRSPFMGSAAAPLT